MVSVVFTLQRRADMLEYLVHYYRFVEQEISQIIMVSLHYTGHAIMVSNFRSWLFLWLFLMHNTNCVRRRRILDLGYLCSVLVKIRLFGPSKHHFCAILNKLTRMHCSCEGEEERYMCMRLRSQQYHFLVITYLITTVYVTLHSYF